MQEPKVPITKQDRSSRGGEGGGSSMKLGHKELVSLHLRPSTIQQLTVKFLPIQTLAVQMMLLNKVIQKVHNVYGKAKVS